MVAGDKGTSRLFWLVIAGVVLYLLLDAVAQLLPPHYSPVRDPESDLAVGPYGYIMTINFLNRGLLSIVFLYALGKFMSMPGEFASPDTARRFRVGRLALWVWGAGAILLAIFPTDVPATPVSWHGAIHLVVAILAFIGGSLGTLLLSLRFSESRTLRGAKGVALAIAVLSVVSLFALLGSSGSGIGGLTERLFLGVVLLWMTYVSVYLSRHPSAPDGPGAPEAVGMG
jgi:Protein of unknown function (DUF998)